MARGAEGPLPGDVDRGAVRGPRARRRFRVLLAPDDATWTRARATALEQALGGILYYTPRRHPLADVMRRTLGELLADDA
ncbi:hypothetical protein [Phycicoccus sp.]|uniref:hypothetical protein n=1 Tax=Phycicoccus sp. TaxID=1902410 RepID=UPI002D144CB1|nr:hypothetical protein [Phycicoccus sp.]HMM95893.1 hypothetical protein [Phycicoccus sp.]